MKFKRRSKMAQLTQTPSQATLFAKSLRMLVLFGLGLLMSYTGIKAHAQIYPSWDNLPDLQFNVLLNPPDFLEPQYEPFPTRPQNAVGSGQYVYFTTTSEVWRWSAGKGWEILGGVDGGNGIGWWSAPEGSLALALDGNNLYIGGSFETVYTPDYYVNNNQNAFILAHNIVRLNLTNGQWSAMQYTDEYRPITALVVDKAKNVYAGTVSPLSCNYPNPLSDPDLLKKWDGKQWTSVGGGLSSVLDESLWITALATDGTNIFAGGRFDTAPSGVYSHGIIKWNAQKQLWQAMGSWTNQNIVYTGVFLNVGDVPPAVFACGFEDDFGVRSIAVAGTNVFVAGDFDLPYGSLARFSSVTGQLLPTDVPLYEYSGQWYGTHNLTGGLAVDNGVVYLTGSFGGMGTYDPFLNVATPVLNANNIASWNSRNSSAHGDWQNLGVGVGTIPSENGWILAADANAVVLLGDFFSAGGINVNHGVARWMTAADQAPIIEAFAGNHSLGGTDSGDHGPALAAGLSGPVCPTFDTGGNLWFADSGNYAIRFVNGGAGGTMLSSGVYGSVAGIAVDPDSNLFVADGDFGGLPEYESILNWSSPIAIGDTPAMSVFRNSSGNLFCVDEFLNTVSMRTPATLAFPNGTVTTVAGISGQQGYFGDGGSATAAQLSVGSYFLTTHGYIPPCATADNNGNIYIADMGNNVVREVNTSGIIETVAGNGTAGYSGNGGPATIAQLSSPAAVAVDWLGNLYIADTGNNVVRRVDQSGNITTFAGTGNPGYFGDGGLPTNALLKNPGGLTFDILGNLYISDTGNDVIREVVIPQ